MSLQSGLGKAKRFKCQLIIYYSLSDHPDKNFFEIFATPPKEGNFKRNIFFLFLCKNILNHLNFHHPASGLPTL